MLAPQGRGAWGSVRTGPPPGSRKRCGTALLLQTVLLTVSSTYIALVIHQNKSVPVVSDESKQVTRTTQTLGRRAATESLQQAKEEIKLKLEEGLKAWVQMVNSIEQLQDVDQQWGDELEALLSRFQAIKAVQLDQAHAQHNAAELQTEAQLGLCHELASIFGKPPPLIELPFSADTKDWEKGLKHEEVYLLDIGANIGTFSLAAAAHGFSVIAFEPMLTNRMAFQLSLCANSGLEERITLVGKGLGNSSATCTLYSTGGNQGDGYVRCGDQSDVPESEVKRDTLEVVRLDEALRSSIPRLRGRVGAVKIDVEGYEPQVLAGAGEFFREVAPPYIAAECFAPMLRDASGVAPEEYFKQVDELGYTIRDQNFQPIPKRWFATYQGCNDNINMFFTKDGSTTVVVV